jgi:hypothetical protein
MKVSEYKSGIGSGQLFSYVKAFTIDAVLVLPNFKLGNYDTCRGIC